MQSLIYPVTQPLKYSLDILTHHVTQLIDLKLNNSKTASKLLNGNLKVNFKEQTQN